MFMKKRAQSVKIALAPIDCGLFVQARLASAEKEVDAERLRTGEIPAVDLRLTFVLLAVGRVRERRLHFAPVDIEPISVVVRGPVIADGRSVADACDAKT
jgi:hypothetical protein